MTNLRRIVLILFIGSIGMASAIAQTAPAASAPAAPTAVVDVNFSPQFLLGSGIGFKPYQTTIRAGSSAFVDFGARVANGLYSFSRVDMLPTYAQVVTGACKTMIGSGAWLLMACGQAGIGADANSVGVAYNAGGKLFYDASRRLHSEHTYIQGEIGVSKTNVPAPASAAGNVNPVQIEFRFGIYKGF